MSTRSAERRIREYEAMGDHRTGRDADQAATVWLQHELRRVAVEAAPQSWQFPRVEIHRATLRFGDWNVPGVPIFDGAFTDQRGVSGVLRRNGGPGIRVIEFGPDQPERMAAGVYASFELARLDGAVGIVMIMGDPDGDAVVRNAEQPLDPINLPVLQVAPKDAAPILDAIGETAMLVIDGGRADATADNVVGRIPGADPDAAPVVVMTPKSGWFTCAAERGGGIAIWLEVAGRIAAQPGRRPLQLVASSGHELHHLGLEHYIAELGEAARDVHTWVHLGASIGARKGTPQYAASDDELLQLATDALSAHGIERRPFPVGTSGYGEARNIGEINGRFISLLGGHPYFHSPRDTFDRCVDLPLLERHIEAVEQMVRSLLT